MIKPISVFTEVDHGETEHWRDNLIHPIRAYWGDGTAEWEKWKLDFAKMGEITNSQNLEIYKNNILDAEIPITYLVDQAPEYDRDWTTPEKAPELQIKNAPIKSVSKVIEKLFNSHNLCSRNWIWEQYDTSVMGDTVIPPGQNSGVIRVHRTNKKL